MIHLEGREASKAGEYISKNILKEKMQYYGFHAPDMTVTEFVEDLPSVKQVPKEMRDATPEERESIAKYIKSISKPTGVNFWDLADGEYIRRRAV